MRYIISFFFYFLCLSAPAYAEIHFYYFGGGEEVTGEKQNNFDPTLAQALFTSDVKKWKSHVLTSTRQKHTQKVLKDHNYKKAQDFSSANLNRTLDQIIANLKDPTKGFTAEDKILIQVDTHGGLDEAEDVLLATTTGTVNITDKLKEIVKLAGERKIRVGMYLGNCYSGTELMQLGYDTNACIISNSAPQRLTYILPQESIANEFFSALSLEDAYLRGRRKNADLPFQPLINTSAGLKSAQDLTAARLYIVNDSIDGKRGYEDRLCSDESKELANLRSAADIIAIRSSQDWSQALTDVNISLSKIEALQKKSQQLDKLQEGYIGGIGRNVDECAERQRDFTLARQYGIKDQLEWNKMCQEVFAEDQIAALERLLEKVNLAIAERKVSTSLNLVEQKSLIEKKIQTKKSSLLRT
ncbi:MAG: hypothetical protein AAGB31_15055, partial [Bdellovibrio sp.]